MQQPNQNVDRPLFMRFECSFEMASPTPDHSRYLSESTLGEAWKSGTIGRPLSELPLVRRRAAMQLPAGVRVAGRFPKGLLFGEYEWPSLSSASGSGVCSEASSAWACAGGDAALRRAPPSAWFS